MDFIPGKTIQYLKSTSGFNFDEEVNFAAAIFVQHDYPIRTLYKETANEIYESEVLNVDFRTDPSRAQQMVNAWVAERTKGRISQIMGDVPSVATRIIIASAMYFKASWEKPFFEGSTAKYVYLLAWLHIILLDHCSVLMIGYKQDFYINNHV